MTVSKLPRPITAEALAMLVLDRATVATISSTLRIPAADVLVLCAAAESYHVAGATGRPQRKPHRKLTALARHTIAEAAKTDAPAIVAARFGVSPRTVYYCLDGGEALRRRREARAAAKLEAALDISDLL